MTEPAITPPSTNDHALHLDASVIACHDCDLLLHDKKVQRNRKASCPRCGAVLHITRPNSMSRTLALSLTGLILFIPANVMPILTLEIMGLSTTNTMINGIVLMAQGGYWWMSLLVCFCSILAPLMKLILLAYTSAGYLFNWSGKSLSFCLKLYQRLDEWGMFDVYMLGILVSYIKMKDMGTLVPGFGLLSFTVLLVVAAACSTVFDSHAVWSKIGSSAADDLNQQNVDSGVEEAGGAKSS